MAFIKKNEDDGNGKEIVALVDIVFLLLFFFIIMTVTGTFSPVTSSNPQIGAFAESEIDTTVITDLPAAEQGVVVAHDNCLIVRFDRDGDGFQAYLLDQLINTLGALDSLYRGLENVNMTARQQSILSSLGFLHAGNLNNVNRQLQSRYGPFQNLGTAGDSLSQTFKQRISGRIDELDEVDSNSKPDVFIRADQYCPYGFIIDLFKICADKHLRDVYFDVLVEKKHRRET